MKNTIYSFLFAISIWVLFLNSASGYASVYGEGVTGAPGDEMNGASAKTCQFCHSTGAFGSPTMTIQFFDSTGTRPVTTYQAGKLYIVRITITPNSGSPAGYGFQMIDLQSGSNAIVKGFLPTPYQNTGIQVTTLSKNARQYAEHNRLSVSNQFDVKWRGPTRNVGNVTFYGAGNAVNGNADRSGDGSTSKSAELLQSFVSTNDLAENIKINLSANPFTEGVTMQLTSTDTHQLNVRVTNLVGQNVLHENWKIISGENQKTLNLSHLTKGAYMLQIIENQNIVTKKIIKL